MKNIIFLFFISLNAHSTETPMCKDILNKNGLEACLKSVFGVFKNIGSAPVNCDDGPWKVAIEPIPPLDPVFKSKDADCSPFISMDKSGEYGEWGLEVVRYLNEQGDDSIFFQNNIFSKNKQANACPRWKSLTIDQKKHFWVWVMASISHIESTCKASARNTKASNGIAIGLLQLDERVNERKWRGPNCAKKSVSNPKDNLRCGLDILSELLKGENGEYRSSGELWGSRSASYWAQLRKKDGGKISNLILHHPFCSK